MTFVKQQWGNDGEGENRWINGKVPQRRHDGQRCAKANQKEGQGYLRDMAGKQIANNHGGQHNAENNNLTQSNPPLERELAQRTRFTG